MNDLTKAIIIAVVIIVLLIIIGFIKYDDIKKGVSIKKDNAHDLSAGLGLAKILFVLLKVFGIIIIIGSLFGGWLISFLGGLSNDKVDSNDMYIYIFIGLIMIFSETIIKFLKRKKGKK